MNCQAKFDELPDGAVLEVMTLNSTYRIEKLTEQYVWISGHPAHCPKPVLTELCRFRPIPSGFTDQGMRLEYRHPERGTIRTSQVQKVRRAA